MIFFISSNESACLCHHWVDCPPIGPYNMNHNAIHNPQFILHFFMGKPFHLIWHNYSVNYCKYCFWLFIPFLCRLNECSWRHIAIQILYVRASVRPFVRPLKFWLTFFKLLLFEQVRFNYNQTWIIGALWKPSHYDALGGHMTRSKVIWGQIVIVISVNLFQIAPVRTG